MEYSYDNEEENDLNASNRSQEMEQIVDADKNSLSQEALEDLIIEAYNNIQSDGEQIFLPEEVAVKLHHTAEMILTNKHQEAMAKAPQSLPSKGKIDWNAAASPRSAISESHHVRRKWNEENVPEEVEGEQFTQTPTSDSLSRWDDNHDADQEHVYSEIGSEESGGWMQKDVPTPTSSSGRGNTLDLADLKSLDQLDHLTKHAPAPKQSPMSVSRPTRQKPVSKPVPSKPSPPQRQSVTRPTAASKASASTAKNAAAAKASPSTVKKTTTPRPKSALTTAKKPSLSKTTTPAPRTNRSALAAGTPASSTSSKMTDSRASVDSSTSSRGRSALARPKSSGYGQYNKSAPTSKQTKTSTPRVSSAPTAASKPPVSRTSSVSSTNSTTPTTPSSANPRPSVAKTAEEKRQRYETRREQAMKLKQTKVEREQKAREAAKKQREDAKRQVEEKKKQELEARREKVRQMKMARNQRKSGAS